LGVAGDSDGARIWRLVDRSGGEALQKSSLTVRLVGQEDNVAGIGASVAISDNLLAPLGGQYVSGEGDGSGQPSPVLHFGLGDYSGTVNVEVVWPLGRRQTEPIIVEQGSHAELEIVEEVDLDIYDASLKFMAVVAPSEGGGAQVNWRFEWLTDHWSDPALEQVDVTYTSPGCLGEGVCLPYDPQNGVTAEVGYVIVNGLPAFLHVLEWADAPCFPGCQFTFTVSSHNGLPGSSRQTSESANGKMPRICPIEQGGEL